MAPKPTGFVQVDVDGLWAVRACYAKAERDTFRQDPCWDEGVPRLQRLFHQAGLPASFFIVGRDLELDSKRRLARKLLFAGHELANHSYTHRIGLTAEPIGLIQEELGRTHRALSRLGVKPVGFRSPGYDVDARVVRVVRQMGYLYDASVLPTWMSPALRLADAWLARRWQPGKRQFGRVAYARAPRRPYFPRAHKLRKPAGPDEDRRLMEIPVGTTPVLRLPLTGASLLPLGRSRLRALFERLAERRRPVLLLLHAIDGTDCRQPIIFDNRRPSLGGFSMSGAEKEKRLARILEEFSRSFATQRTDEWVRAAIER